MSQKSFGFCKHTSVRLMWSQCELNSPSVCRGRSGSQWVFYALQLCEGAALCSGTALGVVLMTWFLRVVQLRESRLDWRSPVFLLFFLAELWSLIMGNSWLHWAVERKPGLFQVFWLFMTFSVRGCFKNSCQLLYYLIMKKTFLWLGCRLLEEDQGLSHNIRSICTWKTTAAHP